MQKKRPFRPTILIILATIVGTLFTQVFILQIVPLPKSLYEKYKKYDKLVVLQENIEGAYYKDVKEEDLLLGAGKGMMQSLNDPYSEYYSEEEYSLLKEQTEGSFVGIGVYLGANDNDNLVISSLVKNHPAEKSGLKKDDIILKVDGEPVKASESTKAISKIKGKAGTSVLLTIKRGNEEFDVKVKREEIKIDSVSSKVIDNNIGYVKIDSFDKNTYKEFKENVESLKKQNITSLIIDLRDNPGGLLDVCVDIADYLLGEGTIVYTKDHNGKSEYFKSDKESINLPIAVLINKGSASASEILTGAIVDNKAGVAIGTTSYGKGLVQSVRGFKDGTGFKLTTAQYFTPSGEYINGKGIEPNIVETDSNKQLERAVEYMKTQNKTTK